jgi:precorrin-2/cobalt-factor-2 C20-methyltransferase
MKGTFYGIGVGPGDPELLTCKAVRILQEVDCVAVPVAEKDKESTAQKIAGRFIRPDCRIIAIDFPMTRDQGVLDEAWQTGCAAVQEELDRGRSVAFLTLGDSLLYSTYIYIYQHLKGEGYPVLTIPGISSFSAAAAVSGVPLAFSDDKVVLLPGAALADLLPDELAKFETLVIFKVAQRFAQIVDRLESAGRLAGSVLIVACGHPEERVITDLRSVVGEELSYFSLIISRKEPV